LLFGLKYVPDRQIVIGMGHNLNRCDSAAKTYKYSTILALRIFVENSQSENIAKDSSDCTRPHSYLFPAYARLAAALARDQFESILFNCS